MNEVIGKYENMKDGNMLDKGFRSTVGRMMTKYSKQWSKVGEMSPLQKLG